MTRTFEPGDVVRAIVDGRAMTVSAFDDFGNVVCVWFDVIGRRQQATFSATVLRKVES